MRQSFSDKLAVALVPLQNHAEGLGIKPDTAMQYATGDARRLASIQRKAAEIDAAIEKINQWFAAGTPTRRRTSSK